MMQSETQRTLDRYAPVGSAKEERAAAGVLQEAARDPLAMQDGEPATQKQIEFLKNLGMPIPQGLTKQAASRLIDEGKARRLAEKLASF